MSNEEGSRKVRAAGYVAFALALWWATLAYAHHKSMPAHDGTFIGFVLLLAASLFAGNRWLGGFLTQLITAWRDRKSASPPDRP